MTNIELLLLREIGMLSGRLAEYLSNKDGVSIEAARKRIERVTTPVHKIKGIFADNQSFVYHSSHYQSKRYFELLNEALEESAKRCAAFVSAIRYHNGVIHQEELANNTFSPVGKLKGHVQYETLLNKLLEFNILKTYDDSHFELNRYLADDVHHPDYQHYKAIQFAKKLLIDQFDSWSGRTGLVSFNTGTVNSLVGGFQFSFTSPTYINGLVRYANGRLNPGFLVMDILIGKPILSKDVDFFIQKIIIIQSSNPSIRLFPVIIVENLDVEAIRSLRQVGVMIGYVKELFGEQHTELLNSLIQTITNAGVILKKDPEKYLSLIAQLTKLSDGKTNNLKGDLFELAVGYYHGQSCKFLEIGKKVSSVPGQKARDIDVLAVYEGNVVAVECKGYNYPVDKNYVDRWLGEIVPTIRDWMINSYPKKVQSFEIWSTGGFSPEALDLLKKAKLSTKKYSINFFERTDIFEKARALESPKFLEILKEYYFRDQL